MIIFLSKVELLDYFPYCSQRISTGSYTGQKQYVGQMYDTDTGLDYLNARYYKASVGQFVSEDPVFWELGITKEGQAALSNPQAMNSYSYAGNNPITLSDPSGKFANFLVLAALYLFSPRQLQADPVYESSLYTQTSNPTPKIYFGGDAIEVGGLSIPEGNVPAEGTYYRGGKSFDITNRGTADLKVDSETGYVTRAKGPSVNTDPNNPYVVKYGGPNKITSLPKELEILPGDNGHASIVPKEGVNMKPKQFQELLNNVQTQSHESTSSIKKSK